METQRESKSQIKTKVVIKPIRNICARVARILIAVYAGILILAVCFESQLVYHPSQLAAEYRFSGFEEHFVSVTSNHTLHAISFSIPSADKWVIFFHGNAGNLASRQGFIKELALRLKRNILAIDYRGYGKSTGSPSEEALFSDSLEIGNYANTELGIRFDDTLVMGRSLGGAVAVYFASYNEVEAVALINTFTSLPDVALNLYPFLPTNFLMRNQYEVEGRASTLTAPVFQAHAQNDELVPFEIGERLHHAIESEKELFVLKGAGHNSSMPPEYFHRLTAFLKKLEDKPGPTKNGPCQ